MNGISITCAEKLAQDPFPDVGKIKAKKGIFKVNCLSCDSAAFCQTNKLVLLEAEHWAKALGGPALKENLGCIQTNLDSTEDTEFSIRMQLFINSREVSFIKKIIKIKKIKNKSISFKTS